MDNIYLPKITNFSPSLRSGSSSDLRPLIEIDWSTNVQEAQFSNAASRAALIQLIDNFGAIIPLNFVSYSVGNKRVTLQPAQDLARATRFKIVIADGILSSDGRKSKDKFQWSFDTAAGGLSLPSLLAPANFSLQNVFPNLVWSTVASTGLVTYQVQLDDNWNFGSPIFSASTTSTSITPIGSFSSELNYYWRIRAITLGATGAWTEPSSFYFGTSQVAHPTSNQTWAPSQSFGIEKIGFTNGLTNLKTHPANISFSFHSEPSSGFQDHIQVTSENQLPRNDQASSFEISSVPGTWVKTGKKITFTPSDPIKNNTRYKITILNTLANVEGTELAEDLTYYWTGAYDPYYITPRLIRASFLSSETSIPDDLISYYIYQASLTAKARYYGYVQLPAGFTFLGDSLSESFVRDTPNLKSFGVLRWVEAATIYTMLKAILNDELRNVGRSRRIGDYSETLTKDFIEAMKLAFEKAKEDLDTWDGYLVSSDTPRTVPKGFDWSPSVHDLDFGLTGIEATRDDFWRIR